MKETEPVKVFTKEENLAQVDPNIKHAGQPSFASATPIVGVGPFELVNGLDAELRPAGGMVQGIGMTIVWQNGPTKREGDVPDADPHFVKTGAFVEDVIYATIKRMEFYQSTMFNCQNNEDAINHLKAALECTQRRHIRRVKEGSHGTHTK